MSWVKVVLFLSLGLGTSLGWSQEITQIPLHKGRIINLPKEVQSVAVGNADVAEVQKLDAKHLYVLGKRIGNTNLVLCHEKDCFKTIEIEVTHDLEAIRVKIHEIFPSETPEVYSSQGSIVLSGQVSSVDKMSGILAVAATFVPRDGSPPVQAGNQSANAPQNQPVGVINLMQVGGPQQVMLGVTVSEIARSLTRRLKVNFNAFGGGGDITSGAISSATLINALKGAASALSPPALFFSFVGRDATVQTVINAAKDNGLAKILAEPNLTTISGQDAEFASGGEFPMPIPQFGSMSGTGGGITVQFKEYGVILKFLPIVLNSGRISLKLNISVSEIDDSNSVKVPSGVADQSYFIPSLTKRNAASSMELDDGQTLGIAGLLHDNVREVVSKFPGLGEIPVLGQLFTSQQFLKNETELMIFVTPHLVKPIDSKHMRLPTDAYTEPSDSEFYLLGRTEGRASPKKRQPGDDHRYGGGLRGHFGQDYE